MAIIRLELFIIIGCILLSGLSRIYTDFSWKDSILMIVRLVVIFNLFIIIFVILTAIV